MARNKRRKEAGWVGASALLAIVGMNAGCGSSAAQPAPAGNDQLSCAAASGATSVLPGTKLIFEYNSTDGDLGVHGLFDTTGWSELCVYDPSGKQILAVKPLSQLKDLTMAGIFFESREPPDSEVSIANHMANFPEGSYAVRGRSFDGTGLTGAATFTHTIPSPPTITAPADDEEVRGRDLVVTWDPVTTSMNGGPITITGYEVIITKDVEDDPHGFSRPTLDVHLPPSRRTLSVPNEFLEADTEYELEVLALEASGNQTITVSFFTTRP